MAVTAIRPDYKGEVKDRAELFHGNQLLFIGWEQHNMICAPLAMPVPPAMPFSDLIEKVLPTTAYAAHPDWPQIDWAKVTWQRSSESFKPDLEVLGRVWQSAAPPKNASFSFGYAGAASLSKPEKET